MEEGNPGACNSAAATLNATEDLSIQVELPSATDYDLLFASPFGGALATLTIVAALGSGTVTVLVNDVPVVGLTNVAVDQTRRTYTASDDNLFSPGDDVILRVVSGGGAMINLRSALAISR